MLVAASPGGVRLHRQCHGIACFAVLARLAVSDEQYDNLSAKCFSLVYSLQQGGDTAFLDIEAPYLAPDGSGRADGAATAWEHLAEAVVVMG